MVLFWLIVIAAILVFVKSLKNQGASSHGTESALEILKKRYAKGEISKEEFEEKKKDITGA